MMWVKVKIFLILLILRTELVFGENENDTIKGNFKEIL